MHDSNNVLIPMPGFLWKFDSDSSSSYLIPIPVEIQLPQSFILIPIPNQNSSIQIPIPGLLVISDSNSILIPAISGIIPESFPILESESCNTDEKHTVKTHLESPLCTFWEHPCEYISGKVHVDGQMGAILSQVGPQMLI